MKRAHVLPFCLALVSIGAQAQTLYKLIDKNGKVTYSEAPPKNFDGKVVPMTIDPNANTATLPKLKPETSGREGTDGPPAESRKGGKRLSADEARANLDKARKAYQNAVDNPGESDVTRVGNVKGGARAVPSEAYASRLAGLEEAVKKAEEDLKRAEGG